MSSVPTIGSVKECFGCSACETVCPRGAVRLEPDALGFRKAVLDAGACTGCGACSKVCPAFHDAPAFRPRRAVSGWTRDPAIRAASSSGGIFSALAARTIDKGGVVFGAAFDPGSGRVRHVSSDESGLACLCGSKYVQSDLGETFRTVRSALQAGSPVLFCGTPCQIAGLKLFLRSPSDRLTTIDFICHGAGSPAVFGECLARHVREHGDSPAESVEFRNKVHGWRNSSTCIRFRNGLTYRRRNVFDPFFQGFVDGCYFNAPCYDCPFDGATAADIRLSDFWGHAAFGEIPDYDKGVSLVFANTELGDRLLSEIGEACDLRELPVAAALSSQRHSIEARRALLSRRERFLKDVAAAGCLSALERNVGWTLPGIVLHKVRRVGFSSVLRRLSSRFFRRRQVGKR